MRNVWVMGAKSRFPCVACAPVPVLRLVMGMLAGELLLASQRPGPSVLADNELVWQHPSLREAAAWVSGLH